MDRLNNLQSFVLVAELGSFSAAARSLDVAQPTVSKQIAQLESFLGVRLFNRSTRALSVTDAGERLLVRAREVLHSLDELTDELKGELEPAGRLRVACPLTFGHRQIMPRMARFSNQYPKIDLEFALSDGIVDLIGEAYDLTIRVGSLADSALVARSIGASRLWTVASPAYIEKYGVPTKPEQLCEHCCIAYTGFLRAGHWHFSGPAGEVKVELRNRFVVNSALAMRFPVIDGLGIALAPSWLFSEEVARGEIVRVLADFERPPMPIHAVYPSRQFVPARVNVFVAFLMAELKHDEHLRPLAPVGE